jgi:DNA-binding NarL/FixJ family response regulator
VPIAAEAGLVLLARRQEEELAEILDVGNPVDATTGLTDMERELLTLLASGLTDEAAGERLGISLRTARRMMADLMARLDASSRFEAGLKAVKCGWL